MTITEVSKLIVTKSVPRRTVWDWLFRRPEELPTYHYTLHAKVSDPPLAIGCSVLMQTWYDDLFMRITDRTWHTYRFDTRVPTTDLISEQAFIGAHFAVTFDPYRE